MGRPTTVRRFCGAERSVRGRDYERVLPVSRSIVRADHERVGRRRRTGMIERAQVCRSARPATVGWRYRVVVQCCGGRSIGGLRRSRPTLRQTGTIGSHPTAGCIDVGLVIGDARGHGVFSGIDRSHRCPVRDRMARPSGRADPGRNTPQPSDTCVTEPSIPTCGRPRASTTAGSIEPALATFSAGPTAGRARSVRFRDPGSGRAWLHCRLFPTTCPMPYRYGEWPITKSGGPAATR
jgi:hypothetical protein